MGPNVKLGSMLSMNQFTEFPYISTISHKERRSPMIVRTNLINEKTTSDLSAGPTIPNPLSDVLEYSAPKTQNNVLNYLEA